MIVHVEKIIEDYNLFTKPANKSIFEEKDAKYGIFNEEGKQIHLKKEHKNNRDLECRYTHPFWGFRSKYIFDGKKYYTAHYVVKGLPYLLLYDKEEKKIKPYVMIDTQREKMVAEFYKGDKKKSFYLKLSGIKGYKLEKKFKINILEQKAALVAVMMAITIIEHETAPDVDTGGN